MPRHDMKAKEDWEFKMLRRGYRNELELGNEEHARDFLHAIALLEGEIVKRKERMHRVRATRRMERGD